MGTPRGKGRARWILAKRGPCKWLRTPSSSPRSPRTPLLSPEPWAGEQRPHPASRPGTRRRSSHSPRTPCTRRRSCRGWGHTGPAPPHTWLLRERADGEGQRPWHPQATVNGSSHRRRPTGLHARPRVNFGLRRGPELGLETNRRDTWLPRAAAHSLGLALEEHPAVRTGAPHAGGDLGPGPSLSSPRQEAPI